MDSQARRETRRHKLPNFLIQTVQTKVQPNTTVINLEIHEYDFSDRPEYLAMTCRPLGGTICPANRTYAVYSTLPTAGQTGIFPLRGSMRWENMNPASNESHFFWEQATVSARTTADTLQILIDRGPGTALQTELRRSGQLGSTLRAGQCQTCAAFQAELGGRGIVVLAPATLHTAPPRRSEQEQLGRVTGD